MATPTLLGPPELCKVKYHGYRHPLINQELRTLDPNMYNDPEYDGPLPEPNMIPTDAPPNMALTENASATFVSTGNPCLDFFFHVVPDTSVYTLVKRLELAWDHDPLTALKLVFNLRGVRGTGKSDRKNFHLAAVWIYYHHPKTLVANVPFLAEFGCFKDLPEILMIILKDYRIRDNRKQLWQSCKLGKRGRYKYTSPCQKKQKRKKWEFNENVDAEKEQKQKQASDQRAREWKEAAHIAKEDKRLESANELIHLYRDDHDFRVLHDRVSDYFAECLKKDLEFLNSGSVTNISLAAKWCPSLDSSYDRYLLLCETIAKRVFPRESYKEYEGVEEAHYAYRVRDRLRKEVLVPLRKVLELPEVFIGVNRWDLIPYNRVASVAMKFYKKKFIKHDKERFEAYLLDVKSGKTTIAAGALLPHEIIAAVTEEEGGDNVAELQWKRMVDDMLKKGKMKSSMAVCDVSGSMMGTPLDVCVALGLLVSELSEEPWKGKIITFSADPDLHVIEGDDLQSKMEFLKNMDWGQNTNFQEVFDLILHLAVTEKLKPEQMIKRLFVFSDMEFDQASENPWETDYQAIKRRYSEKGYGDAVPQIVFWNLRDSKATPVPATQEGVALLSGFSKNLLTLFLDNDGDLKPEDSMKAAITGPEYDKLVVVD